MSQNSSEKDWFIFCNQLRNELSGATFVKVENNFLYIEKKTNRRFGLPKGAEDFRKSNANGRGYQPMLHHVKNVEILEEEGLIEIKILMVSGEEKLFYYRF